MWASTYTLSGGGERYFVKLARHPTLLACEADGLRALARTDTVRVPGVVVQDRDGDEAWLVLEWLDMSADAPSRALGTALASLHRAQAPSGPRRERFGWHRDNWLGGTRQANGWCDDWCTFFRERRLVPQLELAKANGFTDLASEGQRVIVALPTLLDGYQRRRRFCMATCGRGTRRCSLRVGAWCSTRRSTSAIARRISR